MALDGAFLSLIKYELEQELIGSRIDRIYQPAKEEIILTLRFKGGVRRVLLSAGAMDARIHLTGTKAEKPPIKLTPVSARALSSATAKGT